MAKNWWFKFDFKVWRTDSDLRRCSFETRGFWLELLCIMHETEEWKVTGSYEELGYLVGCSSELVARCSLELKRTKTADVTLGNGNVTLVSRRLKRELKDREQTRLRVRRHRRNALVTAQSKSNKKEVRNQKKEIREEGSPPLKEIYFGTAQAGLEKRMGIKTLPSLHDWKERVFQWGFENDVSVERLLQCYDRMKADEFWKTKSINAKTFANNLPELITKLPSANGHSSHKGMTGREWAAQITAEEEEAANAV